MEPTEVNAFQRVADVAIQKSIREGFGLVVSEAVWKETPVAGNTGGIPLQIQNGVGGFLVNTIEECTERTIYLLTHPDEAHEIARRGYECVKERFLMPRLLRDELRLIHSLLDRRATPGSEDPAPSPGETPSPASRDRVADAQPAFRSRLQ